MAAPRLGRLIDPAGLGGLVEAAVRIAPGMHASVRDSAERTLAEAGARSAGSTAGTTPRSTAGVAGPVVRSIVVDGEVVGSVCVSGEDERASILADVLARSVELAAAEGVARRVVTAAAIDDLRELALLIRLSETIGAAVDAAGIAGCVLETISRPLDAAVGVVLSADDATSLAASGPAGLVDDLREAAGPLLARLRDEDPTLGSCAEIGPPGDDRFGSILATFLRTARGHHGSIVLGRPRGTAPFTAADRQLVASIAGQAAIAIERIELQRAVAERRVIDHELAIGRRIQISLMPRRFPVIDGWEFASVYEPAREVGGDFYDVFRIRDRRECIGLVVADVTGKGIPAAILMADSRGLIHAAADQGIDPAETLARVNRILVDERASGLFVTVAHAVLDSNTGRVVLARAGHDPVHLLRADGRLEILEPPGRLIGMVADLGATSVTVSLEAGDALVGHTDGVTEARASDGAFYGEERFRELLVSLAGKTAAGIVDAVAEDVARFRGAAEPSDDLTLLVVRRQLSGSVDPRPTGSSPE